MTQLLDPGDNPSTTTMATDPDNNNTNILDTNTTSDSVYDPNDPGDAANLNSSFSASAYKRFCPLARIPIIRDIVGNICGDDCDIPVSSSDTAVETDTPEAQAAQSQPAYLSTPSFVQPVEPTTDTTRATASSVPDSTSIS